VTTVNFTYKPLPVHHDFHVNTARERALFGAFGSGKTYAIVAEAIAWCLEQPGIRGVIIRKTAPELRDTVEPIFFEMLPPELFKSGEPRRSGGHYESFTFANGSQVMFRSLDDWNKLRSLNVGFLAYDEANEIDAESYQGMLSRVRQKDLTKEAKDRGYTGQITRRGVWLATNPNGKDWLWERFVSDKSHENTAHFKSTSLDNPHLPPEYVEALLSYPEPWVRRYVLCSFEDFGGSIYPDFAWDTHVIPPLKDLPRESIHWMGMDPGTRNPTAGLWVWADQVNRRLVGIAEYQQAGLAATAHAQAWRQIEAKHKMNVRWRVADPSIATRDRGTNMALSDIYRRLGYKFQHGPKSHKDRIPALGQLIHTGRFVLTTECPMTYEAIKGYRWEDITPAQRSKGVDPREVPLKKDEHLVDCSQYLASRWVRPIHPESITEPETFSDEVWRMMRRKIRSRGHDLAPAHDLGGLV
jgi:PBSX family phage terminase large subunit